MSQEESRYLEKSWGDWVLGSSRGSVRSDILQAIEEAQAGLPHQPVRIVALIKKIGRLSGVEIKVIAKNLDDRLSGSIEKDRNGERYIVTVNSTHAPVRQRFTLAHELAHFILHREKIGDGIKENLMLRSEDMSGKDEWQANSLAASILMPRRILKIAAGLSSLNVANGIAGMCEVSKAAAQIRLGYYVANIDPAD